MENINSMTLEFSLNKQTIRREDNFRPVAGSKNYLYAHFTFDKDWEGLEKVAVFNFGDLYFTADIDENTNKCKIMSDIIKPSQFRVAVKGFRNGEEVLVTSSPATVGVTDTLLSDSSGEAPIRYINSMTLDVRKDGDVVQIELPFGFGDEVEY